MAGVALDHTQNAGRKTEDVFASGSWDHMGDEAAEETLPEDLNLMIDR